MRWPQVADAGNVAAVTPLRILITGSQGLLGRSLVRVLEARGHAVTGLDLRAGSQGWRGDVRDVVRLRAALEGCTGVVHLAAVSRVVWAERDPALCQATNIDALRALLALQRESPTTPWVLFVSSREVYGQPATLPAIESTPLAPVNTYGRSKAEGERLCEEARAAGARIAVVRLSNVYGRIDDHPDRVVPAFVHAALAGRPLRLEGGENTFDFTYVDDAVLGLVATVDALVQARPLPPPIHFLTGAPTTLRRLAELTLRITRSSSPVQEAPPRSFDVARFVGDPSRAWTVLGWRARVPLVEGLTRLVRDFRDAQALPVEA